MHPAPAFRETDEAKLLQALSAIATQVSPPRPMAG